MSGDLINRKRLMDALRGNVLVDVTEELEKTVYEQPTAFDIKSVIDKLEKKRDFYYAEMKKCSGKRITYFDEMHNRGMAHNYAIKILRSVENTTNEKNGG